MLSSESGAIEMLQLTHSKKELAWFLFCFVLFWFSPPATMKVVF